MARLKWLLPVMFIFILSACTEKWRNSYNGITAKQDRRVTLEAGGPRSLFWETNDLIINGTYQHEGDGLDFNGQIMLQSRLSTFPNISHMWVNVHFLDSEGVIVRTYRLWTAVGDGGLGGIDYFIKWDFDHRFATPAATHAMTFSYDGAMLDSSSSDGGNIGGYGGHTGIDFWRTP